MVLDMGRGGCTHTITVVAGKEQLTVKPTAVQLLPQPARKLGPPPGHTAEGFDNTETLGSYAVGAAALYDFLPTAELDISDPHETQLSSSSPRAPQFSSQRLSSARAP